MITTHQLPEEAFTALASGDGDASVVQYLRGAQHSKHLMLLREIALEGEGTDPEPPAMSTFQQGLKLLRAVQKADPDTVAWLFSLPHIGAWAHDCVERKEQGLLPDYGYLANAAAAAGVRAGVRFELDVPVNCGRVLFPGLGHLEDVGQHLWIRVRSDGIRLDAGAITGLPCAALIPDDGTGSPVPQWRGTHLARAAAEGRGWATLLETTDRYLDRFALPMSAALTAEEVAKWRDRIQSAWEVLVRHHGWAADAIGAGVSVIVPLTARSATDLDSATTPAAFGAIATSWPSDPVIMAEILVHEFNHLKLCALLDMVSLMTPCNERVYAPWRKDPRPAGGFLQGVYAHVGVARFWSTQRHAESEPDDVLRAQAMFERWRSTIEPATATLLATGCLTPDGTRVVTSLREEGRRLGAEPVPAGVRAMVREVALDHRLTWQLRHMAADSVSVTELAAAYQRGESLTGLSLPAVRVEEDARKISSTVRSHLLSIRYLEPRRNRDYSVAGMPGLSEGDSLLVDGQFGAAVEAYRREILAAAEPVPDSWSGLALAVHLLPRTPLLPAFATHLPLMFDVHAYLWGQGVHTDPLDLAAWFA